MEPLPRDLSGLRRAVGGYLSHWRTASGLSQPQIAEEIGVTQHYVSLLENGRRSPSAPVLRKIIKRTKPADDDVLRARLCLAASKIRDSEARGEVIDLVSREARHLRSVAIPDTKSSRLGRELEKDLTFMATWNRVAAIYKSRKESPNWQMLVLFLNGLQGVEAEPIPAEPAPARQTVGRGPSNVRR